MIKLRQTPEEEAVELLTAFCKKHCGDKAPYEIEVFPATPALSEPTTHLVDVPTYMSDDIATDLGITDINTFRLRWSPENYREGRKLFETAWRDLLHPLRLGVNTNNYTQENTLITGTSVPLERLNLALERALSTRSPGSPG